MSSGIVDTHRYDYINIGLMLFACALAFVLPFELFLFSYAVLGPLHYLTEISWLHKRNYFTLKGKDWRILYVAGLVILFFTFFDNISMWLAGPEVNTLQDLRKANPRAFNAWSWMYQHNSGLTFFAFGAALIMILVKSTSMRIGAYVILGLVGFGLSESFGATIFGENSKTPFYLLFAIFVPTLIHVFFFTAAFMLFGALKSKSTPGLISVLVLGLCAASFFIITPEAFFAVSENTRATYGLSTFDNLTQNVMEILVPIRVEQWKSMGGLGDIIYDSEMGIIVTRFIAFAYTYHYLNWFSKTRIIKWHEVPRAWLISVFVLWAISVGLYYYNYYVGLMALYFLSFLHVFLEFPLNWVSFKGIGEELGKRFGRGGGGQLARSSKYSI
jgi:hypothetical protein